MAGLNAITFVVLDMAASLAFWQRAGFEIAYGGPDAPFTSVTLGDGSFVNLSANEANAEPGGRWGRVIVHVASVEDVHAAMVDAGYEPHAAPKDAPWGERYFHITDPDGNEVSFARPL